MQALNFKARPGAAGAFLISSLLEAWEEGAAQSSLARAITLLAAALPEKSAAEWASVSIGERDRALLRLREELFGSRLDATAVCPACGERMQLTFATRDILTAQPESSSSLRLSKECYDVVYRLPTSTDLLEISENPARAASQSSLMERCIEAACKNAEMIDAAALPHDVIEAVGTAMALADPQAEVRIALTCPSCSHQWSSLFDILSFLWGEIEDWARRLMAEVHVLASAYGWSEREIVALSPRRRRMYLEMVNG